jgi:O-antigen/teichoic acid export membrane protein
VRPALLVLAGGALAAAIWGLGFASQLGLLGALMALFAAGNVWVRANRVGYIVSRTWKPFFVTTVGYQVVLIAAAGALVLLDVDAVLAWALVYLVATVFVVLHLWMRRRRAADVAVEIDVEQRALRRLGIALLPASLGNTAMLRADRLLLPLLSSSAQLGLYVLVATATELASWPVQQYIDVSLRSLRSKRPTVWRRLLMTALGMAVGLGLGTLAALVCWPVIEFALPAYRDALGLLPPLVIATAIYSGTRVQQGLLIAADRPGRASTVELAGMVAACMAYAVLIPWLGAFGAAWGSVLGYGLALVVGCFVTAGTSAAAAPGGGASGQEPGQAATSS